MFRGAYTALVTPFRDNGIDFAGLEKLVEEQIAASIDGIVAVGTTGESPTLTHEERESVIRRIAELVNGRCAVLAGTGSYSTRDAIEATKRAKQLGATAALVVSPYYNKPSQEGLFRHFKAVADSSSLPIMLYNIPGRCGVDISADTVARLAEASGNIVSIKEAGGNVERVSELRARLPESFTVLSGDDSLTLPFMSVGGAGVVSVMSNAFPVEVASLVKLYLAGDVKAAQALHHRLFALSKDLFIEPNPVPVKAVLGWRGIISPEVRLPLCEMGEANQARLRKTLDAFEKSK